MGAFFMFYNLTFEHIVLQKRRLSLVRWVRWEYKVLKLGNNKMDISKLRKEKLSLEDELNQLGFEGWEMLSYTPIYSGYSDSREGYTGVNHKELIFKRLVND